MLHVLRQIARTGIKTEPKPSPAAEVVAVGDCGCTGGIFGESYATCGRVANVIPVDVAIPGCPPTPTALLQGILAAIAAAAPPDERVEPTAGLGDSAPPDLPSP